MNQGIAKRRAFLAARKNLGKRVTIGFTGIADFRSFIGQEYLAGMMKAAHDYDINFINMAGAVKYSLFDDIDFIPHYLKKFRFMRAPLIDGLITWASTLCQYMDDQSVINTFTALKPLPMVDIGYLDIPGVPSIRIDNSTSIQQMMTHLIQVHKYTRFVFIGTLASQPHRNRLEAFKAELAAHGLGELQNSVYTARSLDPVDIAKTVGELCRAYDLHGKQHIDAIVTSSDIIAASVIDELEKRGIHVPNDVAITGFNNQYAGLNARSPVTTLNLEYFKRGYTAVELLINRIMEPSIQLKTKRVHTTLVLRQSCGCFEQSITAAGCHTPLLKTDSPGSEDSEDRVRAYLHAGLQTIIPQQPQESVNRLIDALLADMYERPEPAHTLHWFQKLMQDARQEHGIDCASFQQTITSLRRIILPLVQDDESLHLHIEDILHQLRALVSVFTQYDRLIASESPYMLSNISHIAINFASATTEKQIEDTLRQRLNDMDIPGITLVLSDNMAHDITASSVRLVLPEPPADIQKKIPYKVYDPAMLPKMFLPQGHRYTALLELLYHANTYFGYAFLEMGNPNIAVYDALRMLMSNALYSVFVRKGGISETQPQLSDEQVASIIQLPPQTSDSTKNGITANEITMYLLEHLDQMTNLEQMAEDLHISKSHLVRRAKELTGYTIQTLHEKLKIEQAKNLLRVENLKLSEIASRLGFQNQNYFSSVFKKNTGVSPRAWSHQVQ